MRKNDVARLGVGWMAGFALALALALVCATGASAQSFRGQYERPTAPSGAAAGMSCTFVESNDDVLNAGDTILYPGDVSVAQGASVILDDADGSQATLIDGQNVEITGTVTGGIRIVVTGDPLNVAGGDGVLNDTVCDSIVASTGISGQAGVFGQTGISGQAGVFGQAAAQDSSQGVSGLQGLLPDTGGSMLLVYVVGFALAGTGLILLRRRVLRR